MNEPRRIVLVAISPRIPAGLLSLEAWALLTSGAPVCHGDSLLAILPWLAGADVEVTLLQGTALEQAQALVLSAQADGTAVWLLGPDGDIELAHALATLAIQDSEHLEIETLPGAWDPAGARLLDVVAVMDRLRGPGGCPWDAEQTHESLAKYLLEEAYEAVDAIHSGDDEHLQEELGDVLLQVAFHARVAEERDAEDGGFSIDDVAAGLVDKLIRRHPHVFSDVTVDGAEQVQANWDAIKRAEKPHGHDPLELPLAMPALTLAHKMLTKAAKHGLAAPDLPKLDTAYQGLTDEAQLGELLWAVVAHAAASGIDAEHALRAAVLRYRESVHG